MLREFDRIFTNLEGTQGCCIESSIARGDWSAAGSAISKGRQWIIEEITKSGLTGRVGGSLTGEKWSIVAQNESQEKYFIVNADESEPGTCKDRLILSHEAHKLLEGALISSFAIGAKHCYIYIRGEYDEQMMVVQEAIDEAYDRGYLGKKVFGTNYSLDVFIHEGAGAYICGEETALLASIEGGKGFPKIRPPAPGASGLYSCPTVVNNVETVAAVPTILQRGADWFKSIGQNGEVGSRVFCISGHVNKPCVVEAPLGTPLKELIDQYADGPIGGWEQVKAVAPGGPSVGMIPKDVATSVLMSRIALKEHGADIGTGAIMVFDNSCNIVSVVRDFVRFYMKESCGQCSPCREGIGWIWRVLDRMVAGRGSLDDIDLLTEVANHIRGGFVICGLPNGASNQINTLLKYFIAEVVEQVSITN